MDKYDDVIDSRDVISRIEELTSQRDDEEAEELAGLLSLAEQASGYAEDWEHGVPLVRDSYFEHYAQELAEDCGMVPDGLAWPLTCIDWAQAANELRMDYTAVEWGGVTYWVR